MNISSLINVTLDSEVKKTGIDQAPLKPGDTLRLRVLEVLGNHRVVADFGKFRANAEITFPVQRGEEFMVKVVETGRQLRFSVLQPGLTPAEVTNRFSDLFNILSDEKFNQIRADIQQIVDSIRDPKSVGNLPRPLFKALAQIQQHYAALTLGENISKLVSELKSYIEHSGIFFEKKIEDILNTLLESGESLSLKKLAQSPEIKDIFLKDVKPQLLLLKDYFENKAASTSFADTKDLANLKAAVDSLLNEINNQQSLAVKKHLHPDPFQVLTFLLPLKENDQHAKVKFYYPKKQKGAARNGFKISILLNMDAMGEIRADLFLLHKELTITFFVKEDVNKQAIESHYSEINTALNNVVEYLVLRTVVSSKKISDFHREDWDLSGDKRVDVRI